MTWPCRPFLCRTNPPPPDATVGSFAATKRAIRTDNHYDAKGDIVLTDNSRLSVTYSHGSPYRLIPSYTIDNPRISST